MKTCEANKYDLAICDPPYGKKVNMAGGGRYARYENHFVPLNIAPGEEFFTELFRVSKNQIIFGGNYFQLPPTRGFFVWDKKQPANFTFSQAEYAWTSFDRNSKIYSGVSRSSGAEKRFHPTQKPVSLYKWVLRNYAPQGNEKIFDPMGGSFSCAIACYDLGRKRHTRWSWRIWAHEDELSAVRTRGYNLPARTAYRATSGNADRRIRRRNETARPDGKDRAEKDQQ